MIVDSNIIIYAIQNGNEALRTFMVDRLDTVYTSDITRLEVVGFHKLNATEKAQLDHFFTLINTLPITQAVIDKAIELRQQRRRSLADAIIAATALLYSLPVLTNNVADFADVTGLPVIPLADILNA